MQSVVPRHCTGSCDSNRRTLLIQVHVTASARSGSASGGFACHSRADCRCGNRPAPTCRGSLASWVTGTDVGRPSPCRKRGFPSDCTLCKMAGAVGSGLFLFQQGLWGPCSRLQHDLLVPVLVCNTTFWRRGVGWGGGVTELVEEGGRIGGGH